MIAISIVRGVSVRSTPKKKNQEKKKKKPSIAKLRKRTTMKTPRMIIIRISSSDLKSSSNISILSFSYFLIPSYSLFKKEEGPKRQIYDYRAKKGNFKREIWKSLLDCSQDEKPNRKQHKKQSREKKEPSNKRQNEISYKFYSPLIFFSLHIVYEVVFILEEKEKSLFSYQFSYLLFRLKFF